MPTAITYDVADGIATITLNRPDRLNAFTQRMCDEIIEAFDASDADDDVRAVVVTGAGRAFCAGADLTRGAETFVHGGGSGPDSRDTGGVLCLRIFRSLKPVIAAMNGPAVGVGASMTLPMDIRVLAEGAKVGFVFAARGIVPDGAASWFLPRIVGAPQALEWCLTGRVFGADEALAGGLVRSIHPADQVLEVAVGLAKE
ncbi:MAG: enoyl-CoA hydratase-related protein, partial [Acidimicrobiales bacterium]